MTTHTKHTPGPWRATHKYWYVEAEPVARGDQGALDSVVICECAGNHMVTAGQREANQRLIAAAPELLAALRDLLAEVDEYFGGRPDEVPGIEGPAEAARAAIAKAMGKS